MSTFIPPGVSSGGTPGGISGQMQFNDAGAFAGVAGSTVDLATGNTTFSARWIQSTNSAASAPATALTGTWFTGGTTTTTKPHFLIEPAGTTSTAWNINGTGIGVNAPSGFTGHLLDLQLNGVPVLEVPATGAIMKYTAAVANCYFQVKGSSAARATFGVGSSFGFAGLESPHPLQVRTNNLTRLTFEAAGGFTVADAQHFTLGTTTGTQIATSATQRLGFYGATAVAQGAAVANATDAASVIAQLNALLARIRALGLIAT